MNNNKISVISVIMFMASVTAYCMSPIVGFTIASASLAMICLMTLDIK